MSILYLVSTPIGNLEDITYRGVRILKEVPLIAAEDTRITRTLLERYQIETSLTSFHDHNKEKKTPDLLDHLQDQDLALVSDAGTPAINDPGLYLVKAALGADYVVHESEPGINTTSGTFARMFGSVMGKSPESPPEPDRLVKEGDVLDVGGLKFNVLHTPGHTPGGISIVTDGIVFSGDTLFNFGIGRTDMPGGSYEIIIDSIVKKLMVLPDETVVYPGHGPRTTIGNERKMNPFL